MSDKNWKSTNPAIKSADVKLPEMLFGYLVGPFGALLIFLWTVEKNLPAEQKAIAERKK